MKLDHVSSLVVDRVLPLARCQVQFLETRDRLFSTSEHAFISHRPAHLLRYLPAFTVGRRNDQRSLLGVTTRKCQNCPVRENQTWTILGLEREIAPLERVKDAAGGHLVVVPR
jgi:hypothetical protein